MTSKKRRHRVLKVGLLLFVVLMGIVFMPRPAEKAIKKRIHSDYSVSEPEFRQGVGHLVGAPLLEGNRITALINGDQIFGAQFEAIRNAKRSITLENFIFRSGKLSAQLVPLLCEKARAGVRVHLIMDSLGCAKLEQPEIAAMEKAGVQFVKYNRTEWHKLLRFNHRDHRKILVVDGTIGFTGGACLADEWMGNADTKERWRDTHFRIEGPIVAQVQGVFMDNWMQTQHEVLHGSNYFPILPPAGQVYAHCFKTGPRDGVETARLVYLYSIAGARKNIRIAHSYFVPDDLMIETLLEALRRGVKIEIITPGIIDANVVRRASRARWDELIQAGVEIYEYQPCLFHCKIMIVDDVWVLAGTVNFDNRSFRLNDEDTLNIWDRQMAEEQIKIFESDKARSRRVTAVEYKARPWHIKIIEEFVSLFRAWL
jgi:cardiolipin synthase